MLKKYSVLLLLMLLVPVMMQGQVKNKIDKKAPLKIVEPKEQTNIPQGVKVKLPGDFVAVDTMSNGFGPATTGITPLCYDPYANILTLVHRGKTPYATGSGEIWYNTSVPGSGVWARVAAINGTAAYKFGRYPSMTISNPTKGDLSATTGAFVWAELMAPSGSGFRNVGYGVDQPVGSNQTFSAIYSPVTPDSLSSSAAVWANDQTPSIFWAARKINEAGLVIFKTQDFQNLDVKTPWTSAEFKDNGVDVGRCVSYNGVSYIGVVGSFTAPDTNNPIISGWFPGYAKSTDDGQTWSHFKVVDFRTITALNKYVRLFDTKKGDEYISYSNDIVIDKDGKVHMLIAVTDTTGGGDGNNGKNAIVELIETSPDVWDAKVITTAIPNNAYSDDADMSLGQMGLNLYYAIDKSKQIMFASWIAPVAGSPDTSAAICQIWGAYRSLNDAVWSNPVNITNYPNISFNCTHLARDLKVNGNNVTAFLAYANELGATKPKGDPNQVTALYSGSYTFQVTGVENDKNVVTSYSLNQNYPNPFNPSTSIKFSLAEQGNVSLVVYDMLGRQVATLLNGVQSAGDHQVTFNASKLASGMYIYTLKAGNFTASKKMLLMK